MDEIELDRRTYNYLKNTTERCIISKEEIELTNLMCHNVFICKEEQCALPQPSSDVIYRVCAKNGTPKGHNCKIGKSNSYFNLIILNHLDKFLFIV